MYSYVEELKSTEPGWKMAAFYDPSLVYGHFTKSTEVKRLKIFSVINKLILCLSISNSLIPILPGWFILLKTSMEN